MHVVLPAEEPDQVPRPRLPSPVLAAALLAATTAAVRSEPEACSGGCRVKLRTGRVLEVTEVQPVDERGTRWRLGLEAGSVIVPVRELREVRRLAVAPAGADPGDVHSAGCDPGDPRLARWAGLAEEAASRHGLEPWLVRAVIAVESCGDPEAVSPKGAVGLMQLLPTTAADYGLTDLTDPEGNIDAGCRHLRRLQDKLGGELPLVLAAYNAGEGAVERAGGVPRYRETQDYVRRVLNHRDRHAPEAQRGRS